MFFVINAKYLYEMFLSSKYACCTLYSLDSLTHCTSHALVSVSKNVQSANYEAIH